MKRELVKALGFVPKNDSVGVFSKGYNGYFIDVDFEAEKINFGKKIRFDKKTTQNFSQEENWVVLECIDRLLEKGYSPSDLVLEKVYPTGHGTSGRLDILVCKKKKAYLMIECKTWGKEFEKEFGNLKKKGGQLFTYFQQDRDAEYLVLYASSFEGGEVEYRNEIVKIEDAYRETGNVKDFYDRWSKLTKQNGIFENWVEAYDFESKALTLEQLKDITQKDSSFIFNRFLEILRHNVVSDKPNAFNKIFTLFLCKIVDENKKINEELGFQWKEGKDDDISFQKRLTDLYKDGMKELLSKEVTDISDDEFNKKYKGLDEAVREKILEEITKIRLQKNNEFAIKEVFDEESFRENAKVLKEVVELLQGYRIRYAEKQQYLSDFFELLLTTGLKQESGQFFTPVPIARFICRAIPLDKIVENKLLEGNAKDLLPTTIDYAAGSGHFLTESMNEIQNIVNSFDESKLKPKVRQNIESWRANKFDWAWDYMYGIEKDYRLVKTAKVGCYLHGDGIARVFHADGLDSFGESKVYKDKLKDVDKDFCQDNKNFDIVISNPPYSVSAFRTNLKKELAEKDFELYKYLTDQSSEIECLFVERTKQLLKEGGVAGVILPSSMLSNTGIYTKTREIILKYFDVVSIVELGSNTFMATGTNTVILFLRRRSDYDWLNIWDSVGKFFSSFRDVSVAGIENVFSKYAKRVWDVSFEDYVSLFGGRHSEKILEHDIYKEYGKIKIGKNESLKDKIIELEKEKLLYFILVYLQKVVLVKSGEKNIEKAFLGYEFSNRRGSEGIHPIQRGKSIDDCTKLFDSERLDNSEKVTTYIYDAFGSYFDREVDEVLSEHVSRVKLVDMFNWDREKFEKNINLNVGERIGIESRWDVVKLGDVCDVNCGERIVKKIESGSKYPVYGGGDETFRADKYNRENQVAISRFGMSPKCVRFVKDKFFLNDSGFTISTRDANIVLQEYLDIFVFAIESSIYLCGRGPAQKNIDFEIFNNLEIPIPPKEIQKKIVGEIGKLEREESSGNERIRKLSEHIDQILEKNNGSMAKLKDVSAYSELKIDCSMLNSENYIGVDNILQNMMGKRDSSFVPIEGTALKYEKGDILLSNIRPYLKKIWYADNSGGSSNDVLVLRVDSEKANSKYVYFNLRRDKFFDYEMLAAKGVKMPKGDKQQILQYSFSLPSLSEQERIIEEIEGIEKEVFELREELGKMSKKKEDVLKKYL